jgi:hypothetical protein
MSVLLDADMEHRVEKNSYDAEFDTEVPEEDFDPEDELGPAKMCFASWVVVPIEV